MPARTAASVLQFFQWWWIAPCGLIALVLLLWVAARMPQDVPVLLAVPAPTAAATVLTVPLAAQPSMPTPTGVPCPPLPPLPPDAATSPGAGWVWRGTGAPGSSGGAWWNPAWGTTLHPDLNHPPPLGPHWDYRDANKRWWRIFPDGRCEPK